MKWQTQETVQRAAARGPQAALRASITHWRQLCRATPGEVQRGRFSASYCALCLRYQPCRNCPNRTRGRRCGTNSFYSRAFSAWCCVHYETPTSSPEWKRWQKAAHKMLAVLEGLAK